jgi:hypothetical protein
MSSDMLQYAVVTLVALAAGATLVHRVLGFIGLGAQRSGCAACLSARGTCAAQATGSAAVQPGIVLKRPPDHPRQADPPS